MRRQRRVGAGLVAGVLVLVVAAPGAAAASVRPRTIPAVREADLTRGTWEPARHPRILVRGAAPRWLRSEASTLAAELRAELGHPVRVITDRRAPSRQGDIVVARVARSATLGGEGYALRIGRTLSILSPTSAGTYYGGQTLLQMLRSGRPVRRGRVTDRPRYPERGLMLDLGRRPYPLPWLEAYVRDMGYLKLNLLHFHLTDDQRWALQVPGHPELATPGALTRDELRRLLRTAAANHVQVVPEIDLPGHAGALLAAHPEFELKAASGAPAAAFSRKLDIAQPAVRAFVRSVLDDVLAMFPGRRFDIGADEYLTPGEQALFPQLLADAQARYGPRATVKDELLGFLNEVDDVVRSHGKTLRAWNDELGPGAVVSAHPGIAADWWTATSPLSEPRTPTVGELLDAGHEVLNSGWFPTYFTDDIGPIDGRPDPAEAYRTWDVRQFCSARIAGKEIIPCEVVPAGRPGLLGAAINAWDNSDRSLGAIADGLFPRLRVLAQKTWDAPALVASYPAFKAIADALGHAPLYRAPGGR